MQQTGVPQSGGTSTEEQSWTGRNVMKHSKGNCTVLKLRRSSSMLLHWHTSWQAALQSSVRSCWTESWVWANTGLLQKLPSVSSAVFRSALRAAQGNLPFLYLPSVLARPCEECQVQSWAPQHRQVVERLQWLQHKLGDPAMKWCCSMSKRQLLILQLHFSVPLQLTATLC